MLVNAINTSSNGHHSFGTLILFSENYSSISLHQNRISFNLGQRISLLLNSLSILLKEYFFDNNDPIANLKLKNRLVHNLYIKWSHHNPRDRWDNRRGMGGIHYRDSDIVDKDNNFVWAYSVPHMHILLNSCRNIQIHFWRTYYLSSQSSRKRGRSHIFYMN